MGQYINNAVFYRDLKRYQRSKSKGSPDVSEYIGECLLYIATNLSSRRNFHGYTFRDEMIAHGVYTCIRYLHNFDPKKSTNPFAYCTQVIWNAFVQYIKRETRYEQTKDEFRARLRMIDRQHGYISQRNKQSTAVFGQPRLMRP